MGRAFKGITTRIVASALGFAVPLAVLTWIVVQHERSEIAATRREQVGLAYARPAISALTAMRTLRLVEARCSDASTAGADCAETRAAAVAAIDAAMSRLAEEHTRRGNELGVSAEGLTARENAASHPDALRAAWQTTRAAVVAAGEQAPTAEEESDVALAEASVDDFAALRMPGDDVVEDEAAPDPLLELENATAALLAYVSNSSGLTADRDRDADNTIDAALTVLPLLAGDAAHLTIVRGSPDVRTSSESAVFAQLVGDRELPLAMDRIGNALSEDVRTWGESEILQRAAPQIMETLRPAALELARIVPAMDAGEQAAYLVRGTAFVRDVGAASDQLTDAADDLLVRRVVALERRLLISLTVAALVTLLTSLVVLRAIRTVLRPLSELATAASKVADGDLNVRVRVRRDDEVGAVARGFNRMTEAVAERDARLQEHADKLQDLVAQKTESLQAILDSMGEGLLVTDMAGVLQPERSKWIEQWLGPVQPGNPLATYLAPDDENLSATIELGIEEIAADIMPFEILASQMPRRLVRDGRELRLGYRLVEGGERERRLVVTLRDATVEVAKERLDRQQRELPAVVGLLVRNRAWFQGSVDEIEQLLDEVANPEVDENVRKRALHTIKGSSAIMGFATFASVCHKVEDAIADDGIEALDAERSGMLRTEWEDAVAPVRAMLGDNDDSIQLSLDEHQRFIDAVQRATDRAQLLAEVRSWTRDKVEDVLRPAAGQAEQLATRLGKRVEVEIQGGWRRLPEGGAFRTFFSTLVHVVRNAVHHGIEQPEERMEAGKPELGTLRIAVEEPERGRIRVRVEDDGRGIHWGKVREAAERRGLASATHDDLIEALFTDGVSTAGQVTDISGRGVGLAAVLAAVREQQGTVSVEARPGQGTTFTFDMRTPVGRPSAAPMTSAVA